MKQKNYTSSSERRFQKRYQRIQRRKDEAALAQDREDLGALETNSATVDYPDQLVFYTRMMTDEEPRRSESQRRRDEMYEAFNRYINERIWQEFRRVSSANRDGLQSTNVFVDEFVESPEEELDDLEAGETCFLDEFIGSFQ